MTGNLEIDHVSISNYKESHLRSPDTCRLENMRTSPPFSLTLSTKFT